VKVNLSIALQATTKRAAKKVYRLFNVDRPSLEVLCSIYYQTRFRPTGWIGVSLIPRGIGDNMNFQQRTKKRISWLIDNQFVQRRENPRGHSIKITGKGKKCLSYYDRCHHQVLLNQEDQMEMKFQYYSTNIFDNAEELKNRPWKPFEFE